MYIMAYENPQFGPLKSTPVKIILEKCSIIALKSIFKSKDFEKTNRPPNLHEIPHRKPKVYKGESRGNLVVYWFYEVHSKEKWTLNDEPITK